MKTLPMIAREYLLTDSLHVMWQQMSEAERSEAGEILQFYEQQFCFLKDRSRDNPLGMAAGLHAAIDEAIAAHQQRTPKVTARISCQKGCAACCSSFVGITPEEATLLRAYATHQRLVIDEARLSRQAAKSSVNAWDDQSVADRRCVFLQDDGACGVYEHRPFACRKHFVISPAIECTTMTHTWRWTAPVAELIATAAYTVFGMGGLAELVKKDLVSKD